MNAPSSPGPESTLPEALARIEQRLTRLEERVGLAAVAPSPAVSVSGDDRALAALMAPVSVGDREELEFAVGQNWFAGVGIVVLTCGVALALSLPYGGLPSFVPSLVGYVLAGSLFLFGHWWRRMFALVAGYFQGAGLALFYYATLRLFFFGATPVLDIDAWPGRALLLSAAGVIIAAALGRRSPWLLGLGLTALAATGILVGAPAFVFAVNLLVAAVAVGAAVRLAWPALVLFAIPATYLPHLLWALNRPWHGREVQLIQQPWVGIYLVLAYAVVMAAGPFLRRDRTQEDPFAIMTALFNCGAGYGLLLLQTFGLPGGAFVAVHLAASAVFLGLAMAYWLRERSRAATFFYAMTGYLALSVALLRAHPAPEIFLWLSLQSLVVVTTALWFRSRFIVVANFFIYAGLVVSYMAVTTGEKGVSLVFGVVALLTARILRWQQQRLELKTELMRNIYLGSAFVVFPYALYHLVPSAYVSVSWVGVALAYYVMNLIVRSAKYRWMGHLTLLLTVGYVIVIGLTQLSSTFRIVSFLVLGSVLLLVSLGFTRARFGGRRKPAPPG